MLFKSAVSRCATLMARAGRQHKIVFGRGMCRAAKPVRALADGSAADPGAARSRRSRDAPSRIGSLGELPDPPGFVSQSGLMGAESEPEMKVPHSDDDVDLHGVLIEDTPKIECLLYLDVMERRTPTLTFNYFTYDKGRCHASRARLPLSILTRRVSSSPCRSASPPVDAGARSEEHTSELQSPA